jgi:hypothetical protein
VDVQLVAGLLVGIDLGPRGKHTAETIGNGFASEGARLYVKAAVAIGMNVLKNAPTECSFRSDAKKRQCIVQQELRGLAIMVVRKLDVFSYLDVHVAILGGEDGTESGLVGAFEDVVDGILAAEAIDSGGGIGERNAEANRAGVASDGPIRVEATFGAVAPGFGAVGGIEVDERVTEAAGSRSSRPPKLSPESWTRMDLPSMGRDSELTPGGLPAGKRGSLGKRSWRLLMRC